MTRALTHKHVPHNLQGIFKVDRQLQIYRYLNNALLRYFGEVRLNRVNDLIAKGTRVIKEVIKTEVDDGFEDTCFRYLKKES